MQEPNWNRKSTPRTILSGTERGTGTTGTVSHDPNQNGQGTEQVRTDLVNYDQTLWVYSVASPLVGASVRRLTQSKNNLCGHFRVESREHSRQQLHEHFHESIGGSNLLSPALCFTAKTGA